MDLVASLRPCMPPSAAMRWRRVGSLTAVTLGLTERGVIARQFRASTELTPMTYVTRARIARAKELLATGARGATIALTVGFCDQSHFNRVFKREVGVTPGGYVRSSGRSVPRRAARLP